MSDFLERLAAKCPKETPFSFLRFTWFGDAACSCGDHYVPGEKRPFEEIMALINKQHSDDLVENLACWAVRREIPADPSPPVWRELCWKFYDLIREDYEAETIHYSPDYPRLFSTSTSDEYLEVTIRHTNCGGAMRSASLAFGGAASGEHEALVGMTHLYPESLAGAMALYRAVLALMAGNSIEAAWREAVRGAELGEVRARELIADWGKEPGPAGRMADQLRGVHAKGDPRHGVMDWRAEGISTRFVVAAAMQVAAEAIPLGPRRALRHVVEQGIAIGGDPDTIGSMGMALIGAHFQDDLQAEIDGVMRADPRFQEWDLPGFLVSADP
jgi:ADP-ribosylglycohydrolase